MSRSLEAPTSSVTAVADSRPSSISSATLRPGLVMAWCVGASVLLVGSGVIRSVQAARHLQDKNVVLSSPFSLKDLPRKVGTWEVPANSETILDDLTTRITGSTDYVIWKYKDEDTGTVLSVLVLYGPAEPVVPHTPQVCYPATGHKVAVPAFDKSITYGIDKTATFRTSVFAKSGGREILRNVVYHSFWLDGTWSPRVAERRFPRRSPGVFKIQIQRRSIDGERQSEANEPIEQFLKAFLPLMDAKIAAAKSMRTNTSNVTSL